MSPKLIAIAALGALTTGALLLLFVDVRAAPAQPSQAKIDDARTRHKRVVTPSGPASDPWAPAARADDAAADTTPAPTIAPRVGKPPGLIDKAPPALDPADRASMGRGEPASSITLEEDPRGELLAARDEANKLYDRQDYERAIALAEKVLSKEPGDIRMLRVVVSGACQMGDADKAKQFWTQLPEHDKNQMSRRCQRFGITFTD